MRTHIDLFSGIGGFALAARWCGLRTVAFCERDEYCQAVLAKHFGAVVADAKCLHDRGITGAMEATFRGEGSAGNKSPQKIIGNGSRPIPIIDDIFTFDGHAFDPAFILTGGFPCQPFSHAGKRRGAEDDRAIWPEMYRVITENRPTWVIGENVAGLISMELDRVLADLESADYAAWTLLIPACAVDAKHRRDRCWIVAHRDGKQEGRIAKPREKHCEWEPEPRVGRVAHGVPRRVDRLKGLGNAIVPQVAYEIMRAICEVNK